MLLFLNKVPNDQIELHKSSKSKGLGKETSTKHTKEPTTTITFSYIKNYHNCRLNRWFTKNKSSWVMLWKEEFDYFSNQVSINSLWS